MVRYKDQALQIDFFPIHSTQVRMLENMFMSGISSQAPQSHSFCSNFSNSISFPPSSLSSNSHLLFKAPAVLSKTFRRYVQV
jgi:hypothetical protein